MTVMGTTYVDMSLSSLVGVSTGALCPGLTPLSGLINGVVFSVFFSHLRNQARSVLSRELMDDERMGVAIFAALGSTITTALLFWVFGRTFNFISLSLLTLSLVGAIHLFKDKWDHTNAVFRR